MLPVAQACSEKHDRSSGCTSKAEDSNAPPARNVFSVAERFTLRSSRSGSSVSATAHSKLAPEIQYWAGVIMRNACRKDEGRGGIRQCANMLCGKWEAYPREFAKCRRCRKAKYCSKACQSKGWQMGHRFWCSAREDEGREKERRRKNLVLRTEEKMGMKELQEVKKEIKNSNVNLSLLLSTIQLMRMRIHLLEEVTFPQAPLMVITITIIVAAATLVEVVRFPSRILLVEIVVKKEVLLMLDPLVVEPLDFSTTPMPTALSQQLLLPPRM